ncbi:transporter substrate-binding domain-containing protein [Pseudomonas sp. LPB0260]|uniref:substrate-binding periplasmic protein n=1 Tax=Pseudomonas sp. LPB0260 TaxID=2614442 RepID=UPI0015C22CCC|nr:transporter substrate-binding domain-containing protein [Pseudomonas sp. LPB0260]QLC73682.1 transporter substrate-binding domain-containing protein [Pseudomonas sp. LPB0260]QLC76456.1 transporter substrate-binding domain-containing protein [Pseudomonas sp. LPB0260]
MRYLLLCLLLTLGPATMAEPWKVVGDEQFAPYSFAASHDATPQGLDVELVSTVLQAAGIDYELRLYPWQRVKRMLEQGGVDMAFQFAGTAERHAQYLLVGPIRTGSTVFMAAHKSALGDWQQLSDLEPYVIGQVKGYAYDTDYDQAPLKRDSSAQSPRQLVSMLLAGRVDLIVGDRVQLLHYARELGAEDKVRILPRPLAHMPRFVAFAKNDQERAARFAAALHLLQRLGRLEAIYQRWGQPPQS